MDSIIPKDFNFENTQAQNSMVMTMEELEGNPPPPPTPPAIFPDKVIGAAKMGLEFIPYGKYLLPENREKYSKMSEEDQSSAMLWEAFGVATIMMPFPGLGKLSKLSKFGAKAARFAEEGLEMAATRNEGILGKVMSKFYKKAEPIEDLAEWQVNHYRPAVKGMLEKQGFKKSEIDAIVDDLHGVKGALDQHKVNAAWAKEGFSEAWNKNVINTGKPYGRLALDKELAKGLAPQNVRRNIIEKKYYQAAEGQLGTGANTEAAFKTYFKKEYGYKKGIGEATDEEISTLVKDMLGEPGTFSKIAKSGNFGKANYFKPARVTFGSGEAVYKTFSNIYKPINSAIKEANKHTIDNIGTFRKMLIQRGLGTEIKSKGKNELIKGFKPAPELTPAVRDQAAKEMRWIDDVLGEAHQGKIPLEHAREMVADRLSALRNHNPYVAALADATYDYFDHLYAERMIWKLTDLFDKAPMTPWGRVGIEKLIEEKKLLIEETFSTTAGKSMTEKLGFIDETLDVFKQFVDQHGGIAFRKVDSGFLKPDMTDIKTKFPVDRLKAELTRGGNGKWMPYHEYYTPRVAEIPHRELADVFDQISGKQTPFYAKPRTSAEMLGKPVSFEEMIYARTRAQSKEMHVYNSLHDVATYTSKLPQAWRDYTEHYIARVLSIPSPIDEKVANLLTNSDMVRGLARAFGRDEVWDAYRVQRLGQTVIDFTYLGYLGFKPFSAMRNLFQPLITVPADLGGLKSFASLAKGYARLLDKPTKDYLDSIGIITRYAPGITMSENLIGLGRHQMKGMIGRAVGKLGIPVPQSDTIRDYAMWMFRGSDMMNRYVTGGAAMHRWETALKKIPNPAGNPRTFMKISGVNGRHDWIRHEIEGHISAGRYEKAKEIFVKDVVADTQYLYGATDAPVAAQVGGVFGRTANVFQSWWMNYGSLLAKWHSTGELPQAGSRMLPWMTSTAIAYSLMEPVWGSFVASKSVGVGPLPIIGRMQEGVITNQPEKLIPRLSVFDVAEQFPGWMPVAQSLHLAATAGSFLIAAEWDSPAEQQKVLDRAKAMMKSVSSISVPGGSQLNRTVGATIDKGFPGFAKSIISMQ